jgi:NAD+ synthase (glutamine-hydrolysing)
LRIDYLFRFANHHGGIVIGTGDLSELALGWCTHGVGDQTAHYNVNSGVPKTLIQHLIRWAILVRQFSNEVSLTLSAIVAAEISPELVPVGEGQTLQSSEAASDPGGSPRGDWRAPSDGNATAWLEDLERNVPN